VGHRAGLSYDPVVDRLSGEWDKGWHYYQAAVYTLGGVRRGGVRA